MQIGNEQSGKRGPRVLLRSSTGYGLTALDTDMTGVSRDKGAHPQVRKPEAGLRLMANRERCPGPRGRPRCYSALTCFFVSVLFAYIPECGRATAVCSCVLLLWVHLYLHLITPPRDSSCQHKAGNAAPVSARPSRHTHGACAQKTYTCSVCYKNTFSYHVL